MSASLKVNGTKQDLFHGGCRRLVYLATRCSPSIHADRKSLMKMTTGAFLLKEINDTWLLGNHTALS